MSIFLEKPRIRWVQHGRRHVKIESYPATTWRTHVAKLLMVVSLVALTIAGSGILYLATRAQQ